MKKKFPDTEDLKQYLKVDLVLTSKWKLLKRWHLKSLIKIWEAENE